MEFGTSSPTVVGRHVDLPLGDSAAERLTRHCSAHRLGKARSYLALVDRHRSLIAGALIKEAMEIRCGETRPGPIQESSTSNGRPVLPDYPHLAVSITHSGPWIHCAIHEGPVGVDVEAIAPGFAEEIRRVISHPAGTESQHSVLRLWTAKESYLKAIGAGFFKSPDSFVVRIEKDRLLVWPSPESGSPEEWRFRSTNLNDGYLLSLCWR